MDEKRLIKNILKGDTDAFGYFVDTYQNMAMTIAYRVCNHKADAEDIVQNAFVRAFQNLHSFKKESKFSSWFYRIVYNLSINYVNKQKSRKEDYSVENKVVDSTFLDTTTYQNEQREKIDEALGKLPHSDAVILSLYYLEGYSVKEITEIVSLSNSNVKIKLFRARQALKEIIEL